MKVIKKINNNVAICLDSQGHELIAFGSGIGYTPIPYDLKDLSIIKRTYYGIDKKYLGLLNEIDEKIFAISSDIIDFAKRRIKSELNPNLIFTLADHINFSIERYKKGIIANNPLHYDVQHLYPTEVEIGTISLKFIERELKIHLPQSEAISIAIHFINAEERYISSNVGYDREKINDEVTEIIEKHRNQKINRNSFNYSRFVTHLQYLLKRQDSNTAISSENTKLFESIKDEFPDTYLCVREIKEYLKTEIGWEPNDEELLYLMLHVNRLCSREDCYQ